MQTQRSWFHWPSGRMQPSRAPGTRAAGNAARGRAIARIPPVTKLRRPIASSLALIGAERAKPRGAVQKPGASRQNTGRGRPLF